MMVSRRTNWAGNVEFTARDLHSPVTVAHLREIIAEHPRVRALGTAHSFSAIADTPGVLVSLHHLPRMIEVDSTQRVARVCAGTTLDELCAELRRHHLAVPNLPSTPHFTLAGACATGTHGSGKATGTLAAGVSSVELVAADGTIRDLSRGDTGFDGVVTSLGALGIATRLTVDLCPAFDIEQQVYEGLTWPAFVEHFDDLLASAYSVSAFTTWSGAVRLWVKHRVGDPAPDLAFTGARPADGPRHPIDTMPTVNATEQMGHAGPWDERLPHFRAGFTPSAGQELQTEYFVSAAHACEAAQALHALREWISPVLQVSEIRTIAADTLWLSPSQGRDSVAFHFTWHPDARAIAPVLLRIEEALAPFAARPHWGKVSSIPPKTVSARYEHWDDFASLLHRMDPAGKFRNELVDQYFPVNPAV